MKLESLKHCFILNNSYTEKIVPTCLRLQSIMIALLREESGSLILMVFWELIYGFQRML